MKVRKAGHGDFGYMRPCLLVALFMALSGSLGQTLLGACPDFLVLPVYGAGTGPNSVALGDFNGDGKNDLAVVDTSSNDVSILLGNGDGTFQAAVQYRVGVYHIEARAAARVIF